MMSGSNSRYKPQTLSLRNAGRHCTRDVLESIYLDPRVRHARGFPFCPAAGLCPSKQCQRAQSFRGLPTLRHSELPPPSQLNDTQFWHSEIGRGILLETISNLAVFPSAAQPVIVLGA